MEIEDGAKPGSVGEEESNILAFPKVGVFAEEEELLSPEEVWEELSSSTDLSEVLIISLDKDGKLGFITNIPKMSYAVYALECIKNNIIND